MNQYLRILLQLIAVLAVASVSKANTSDSLSAASIDTSAFKVSNVWKLDVPAYAQIKVAPNQELHPRITLQDWGGLWEPYREFRIAVGYAEGKQISPAKFNFVSPRISIRGADAERASGHSKTVDLFDKESAKDDIKVRMLELPETFKTDREYKVAVISGKGSTVVWTLYLRFLSERPTPNESRNEG